MPKYARQQPGDRQGEAEFLQLELPADPLPPDVDDGVNQAIANTDAWWMSVAITGIKSLAESRPEFTADHLRELIPPPDNFARWGAAFRTAQTLKLIKATGRVTKSTSPARHGSLIQIWRRA